MFSFIGMQMSEVIEDYLFWNYNLDANAKKKLLVKNVVFLVVQK